MSTSSIHWSGWREKKVNLCVAISITMHILCVYVFQLISFKKSQFVYYPLTCSDVYLLWPPMLYRSPVFFIHDFTHKKTTRERVTSCLKYKTWSSKVCTVQIRHLFWQICMLLVTSKFPAWYAGVFIKFTVNFILMGFSRWYTEKQGLFQKFQNACKPCYLDWRYNFLGDFPQ